MRQLLDVTQAIITYLLSESLVKRAQQANILHRAVVKAILVTAAFARQELTPVAVLRQTLAQIAAMELIRLKIGRIALNAILASTFLTARHAVTVLMAPTHQLHKKVAPSLLILLCINDIFFLKSRLERWFVAIYCQVSAWIAQLEAIRTTRVLLLHVRRAMVVLFLQVLRIIVNYALLGSTACRLKVVVHSAMSVIMHLKVVVPIVNLARSCTLQMLGHQRAIWLRRTITSFLEPMQVQYALAEVCA